ncbi:hypothetical protein JB92DRAFT_2901399 [Gautieria morchelliformis]|nr:hypothetical protein JB92DRAFT_2901399 [Gautieria morchelliformis]
MPFAQDIIRPYARLATTNRLMLYGATSTLAVSLVILNAFKSYSNFYSVAVHLSRSNRSVMVLANFGILGSLMIGRGFQHLLFGSLRANEVERLYDRIWFFLTESLLAFTIFRDEFDVSFAVMFGFLLFVKCFHWLMSFRIEWMDQIQYPGPNVWFHVRMNILFLFLWFIDTVMLCFAIESILTNGIGGVVLFASEYAILMASALNSMVKYFIIFYDVRRAAMRGGENAPVWEDKSMYIFYVELATDFLKLVTYLTFFLLVLTFYGLPLNIVRDVYMTARSFINRCRDLVRYRTATRNMDERYPNATEEELSQMSDRTCIICREEMLFRSPIAQPAAERTQTGPNDTPKRLPCGHVFHFHCLRSWLERQQSCPTCRRTVLETRPPRQNAGGQDQPPAAPAPNPPQMQGFGGPGGGQPPAPGFFARWLGGAGAPIVPGQFAPGPGGFNPAPPNHGQFQGQQGFPGPNPFGPWQQPGYYAPPQQAVAPVQVLQGFYIGNQWQPWGAPVQQRQVRPQGQPHAAPTPPPATPTPTSTPTTQPVGETGGNTSQAFSHPSVAGPSIPREVPGVSASPREAARLAALRRMGSEYAVPPSSPQVTNSSTTSSTAMNNQHGTAGSAPAPSPSTAGTPRVSPAQPTSSASGGGAPSSATAGSGPPPATVTSRPGRPVVPSLIPLFDPATTSATIVTPPTYHRMPPQGQYPSYPNVNPQAFNQQRLRPRPTDTSPQSELLRGTSNSPDLRSLPQTLTQEQLNRLDTTTREAIDERLRVLENVQVTVWRCVEELLRARSVMPRRNESPSTQAQQPVQNPESRSEKVGDTPDNKGKTKVDSSPSSSTSTPSSSSSLTTEDNPGANAGSVSETTIPATLDVGPQPVENDASAIVAEVFAAVAEPAE